MGPVPARHCPSVRLRIPGTYGHLGHPRQCQGMTKSCACRHRSLLHCRTQEVRRFLWTPCKHWELLFHAWGPLGSGHSLAKWPSILAERLSSSAVHSCRRCSDRANCQSRPLSDGHRPQAAQGERKQAKYSLPPSSQWPTSRQWDEILWSSSTIWWTLLHWGGRQCLYPSPPTECPAGNDPFVLCRFSIDNSSPQISRACLGLLSPFRNRISQWASWPWVPIKWCSCLKCCVGWLPAILLQSLCSSLARSSPPSSLPLALLDTPPVADKFRTRLRSQSRTRPFQTASMPWAKLSPLTLTSGVGSTTPSITTRWVFWGKIDA